MWIKITSNNRPAEGKIRLTKIDDGKGERNVQELKRSGNLYFTPDGKMHVYYTPTHFWID